MQFEWDPNIHAEISPSRPLEIPPGVIPEICFRIPPEIPPGFCSEATPGIPPVFLQEITSELSFENSPRDISNKISIQITPKIFSSNPPGVPREDFPEIRYLPPKIPVQMHLEITS